MTTETKIGVVEQVTSKVLASGKYYSFRVGDEWFRTNKTKPPVEAGYKVKFTYTTDKYGNHVNMDSITFKPGEEPKEAKKAVPAGRSQSEYWEQKEIRDIDNQKRISFQAATNTAISMVNGAIEFGFLKLKGGAKASVEAYYAAVMDQAENLYRSYQLLPENHDEIMANGLEAPSKDPDDLSDITGNDEPSSDDDDDDDWAGGNDDLAF